MSAAFDHDAKRAIRQALATRSYQTDSVRIVDHDISGWRWIVASHNGVFAAAPGKWKTLIHGWFFGICRDRDSLYLFENCGRHDRTLNLGRLIRIGLAGGQLGEAMVLAKGLDGNCHQVRVIDDLICVVDTANQAVLRFSLGGAPVDIKRPFPIASPDDRSGAYLHINSIGRIGGRLVLMLHNGKAIPQKRSELAWLDDQWQVTERSFIEGHQCHDLLTDSHGTLWHSASASGEIIASDGRRAKVHDSMMTRALAFNGEMLAVGLSIFSERHLRDGLRGGLAILNRELEPLELLDLPGSPTDIVGLAS
ncbi:MULTISPECIES: hypothetical protein [unclassified Novosphingobium]|uniref:hypothetical protein n=1 Tax=unclassified Novosphingobium TaxID=2644732 RepID=UPI000ED55642|nr:MULTISPECIES: hypothetical protein [unclassified Novosphingobium]HCF25118.1 hypothetical protein [Novosphingobium sp.]HQV02261.1 hypothetical protein [Novosphingobium sp.]